MKRRVEKKEKIFLLGLEANGKPGVQLGQGMWQEQKVWGLLGGGLS